MTMSRFSADDDLVIPWSYVDYGLQDDEATEQHKAHIGQQLHKRSIRHYRHATSKWGAALENFSPLWFALCISSGGIAEVLNGPFPYPAHWLVVLATILYVTEIVLFFTFLALLIAKWVIYPHVAVRRIMRDPDELGTYAIPPIALMTIGALTITQVSDGPWGGHAFTLVGYVVWWIGVAWIFITAIVVLTILFYTGNQADRFMTPVLFMAPVGLATAATEAGLITIYGFEMSSRLAVPQLIVGYFAAGVAFFMAILLYTVFFHRLLAAGWGPAAKRAGLFILIGPCGQLATAFQLLGESASAYMRFAQYKPSAVKPPTSGTFWTEQTAQGVDGAGIFLALLLLGFDYLWFCVAIIGVVDVFVRRQQSYSLVWWSIVFPTVTLTTAWLELASSMDSPTFRALTCALTVFLVIAYFTNMAFTLRGLLNGSLIFGGKSQLEIEEGMMKKAQDELESQKSEV
ncbi:C4-dicarboxylate transporter/malic acid transport protein, partial [Aureobasidium melanogenum]